MTVSVRGSLTHFILSSLNIWTKYFIKIAVTNGDYLSPWSNEIEAWTKQDGLFYSFVLVVSLFCMFICLTNVVKVISFVIDDLVIFGLLILLFVFKQSITI